MFKPNEKLTSASACYKNFQVPVYRGNPLIEALHQPPLSHKETLQKLLLLPTITQEDLELHPYYRSGLPQQYLKGAFVPTMDIVKLTHEFFNLVLAGYAPRNPMIPAGQALLYREFGSAPARTKYDESSLSILRGPSGVGKTATIKRISQVVSDGLIQHSSYWGIPFHEKQLPVLYVKLPAKCTPEALAKEIAYQIESQVGSSIYQAAINDPGAKFGDLMTNAIRLCVTHHVGLIIIDDSQWLRNMGAMREEVFAMLVNFRSLLKIPVMLVGTHQLDGFLQKDASVVSRAVEGGIFTLSPMTEEDGDWNTFATAMWSQSWVSPERPQLKPEISSILFETSQGIRRLAIAMIVDAQKHAIMEGHKEVTPQLLKAVFQAQAPEFRLLVAAVKRWRKRCRNGLASVSKKYEAMFPSLEKALEKEEESEMLSRIDQLAKTILDAVAQPQPVPA